MSSRMAGGRVIDLIRRRAQLHVMRRALKFADLGIFTIPLDVISWLGKSHSSATFIPVGANLACGYSSGREIQRAT